MLSCTVLQIALHVECLALDLAQVELFLLALGQPLLLTLLDINAGGNFTNGTSRPIKSA